MPVSVSLDKAGRVVIPKPLRDKLQLEAGDTLEVEAEGDSLTLRPKRSEADVRKKRGVWVFRTGEQISAAETEEALRRTREERERPLKGLRH